VGNGIDHLRSIAATRKLDLKRVVLGHAAGGHPALWAGARKHLPAISAIHTADPLPLRGVIDLAGTPDMVAFFPLQRTNCGGRPIVEEMLGGTPAEVPQRYSETSTHQDVAARREAESGVGKLNKIAPVSLGEAYMAAAKQRREMATSCRQRSRPFRDRGSNGPIRRTSGLKRTISECAINSLTCKSWTPWKLAMFRRSDADPSNQHTFLFPCQLRN
jgi:hypothetical protein